MTYELMFLRALAVTVAVETVALWAVTRLPWPVATRPSFFRLAAGGFFCSFATLPYLWFVLPAWIKGYYPLMAVGELGVTLMEGLILAAVLPTRPGKGLVISLFCNLISFLFGLVFLA